MSKPWSSHAAARISIAVAFTLVQAGLADLTLLPRETSFGVEAAVLPDAGRESALSGSLSLSPQGIKGGAIQLGFLLSEADLTKSRVYPHTRFTEDVLRDACRDLRKYPVSNDRSEESFRAVHVGEVQWTHDSEEEFFSDYRHGGRFLFSVTRGGRSLRIQEVWEGVEVHITALTRHEVEALSSRFEQAAARCRLPEPPEPPKPPAPPKPPLVVFIGHGHSGLWKELKDHLHEKHGYVITAYEIGARAGHAVRDILQDLLAESSFALLVMTGEDTMANGGLRARQNVVHEAGLFQGRLGFSRAVVLLEDGTDEFSNLDGIEQIRFKKGAIRETFGDVLATIRREFPEGS